MSCEQELLAVLERVRSRWRASVALRAWTRFAAASCTVMIAALLVVRFTSPTGGISLAIWLSAAVGVIATAALFLRPLRTVPSDRQLARYVEERCPELDDVLVTAVSHGLTDDGSPVRAFVINDAVRRIRGLDLDRIIDRKALGRLAVRASVATMALVALLVVSVSITWQMAIAGEVSPAREAEAVATTGVLAPGVTRIDVHYTYPEGFGLEPRVEEDGGDLYGPAGTRVRLTIHADAPVRSGSLVMTGGRTLRLEAGRTLSGSLDTPRRAHVVEGSLTILEDGSYRVALIGHDGTHGAGDTEYFIRTLQDSPPEVRIIRPGADRLVTPIEEVPIEAKAEDDFGIAAFDLVFSVRGGKEQVVPFRRAGSALAADGERTIYLEELGVKPGDFVSYYARARDISRGKRSSEARSDIFFLEVRPFEEEFVAGQGAAGSGAGQGQEDNSLEALIAAQKDVITATWRLDRRHRDTGRRSGEDIRSVARAQDEIRRRATSSGRSSEPMQRAVQAMSDAHTQLEALDTSAALPPEMTALNELLRAQAEIRRREVQRQQSNNSSGGAGSNRQTPDLSSLFDRELARQQTNYETPATADTRQQENTDDALEKLRELARRQEALNRQQQQASTLNPEERKRALERLTREQSELRREAEQLAQQLQRGTPARGRGQASRALQEASEEMQSAAGGLRREDQRQAAASGERALDRLRQTERQMRGGSGAERDRDDAERRATEQLARARELRDRLERIDRQLAEMQRTDGGRGGSRGRASQPQSDGRGAGRGGEKSDAWGEARELLEQARRERELGLGTKDVGGFNPGLSAPGTEEWKQDYARWEQLKVQLAAALETAESKAAKLLRERHAKDRLHAGGSNAVPDRYRELVDKYYRALAGAGR